MNEEPFLTKDQRSLERVGLARQELRLILSSQTSKHHPTATVKISHALKLLNEATEIIKRKQMPSRRVQDETKLRKMQERVAHRKTVMSSKEDDRIG